MNSHEYDPNNPNKAHILPISTYVGTFTALAVLMLATIAASKMAWPSLWIANIIALTIATIKASLVIRNFMHLKYSGPISKLYFAMGLGFFALIFFIAVDYQFRQYEPVSAFDQNDKGSGMAREFGVEPLDKPSQRNVRPRYYPY